LTEQLYGVAVEDQITRCPVIITTTVNAGSAIVTNNFGKHSDSIVVFHDERFRDDECSAWVAPALLSNRVKNEALFLFGDSAQPGPLVLSAEEYPNYNEFSEQPTSYLGRRLIKGNFPQMCLWQQSRMRPALVHWTKRVNYKGRLQNSEVAETLQLNPAFEAWMRQLIGPRSAKTEIGRVVLSLND
jgi:hypothetical protein